jgi:hypothetical protein
MPGRKMVVAADIQPVIGVLDTLTCLVDVE